LRHDDIIATGHEERDDVHGPDAMGVPTGSPRHRWRYVSQFAVFQEAEPGDIPLFYVHLGDVVYNFGERLYYFDQFYDPYRDYPTPIIALAGNHDGMVAQGTHAVTLDAFLANFCASTFRINPEAEGLSRTAQIQPGVFFTFEAPLVRIPRAL
jgi:hypothetical protein